MWGLIWYLTIAVLTSITTLRSGSRVAQAVSPRSQEEVGEGGTGRQDSSWAIQRKLLTEEDRYQQRGVDVQGRCRDRRSGVVYDTENPLFDFNVLVTGLYGKCDPVYFQISLQHRISIEYRVALYYVSMEKVVLRREYERN